MSKSILTIDTPKGCVSCPIAKTHGFNAFHKYPTKKECVMDRQPYIGITCPFCNGMRYIYDLTDEEVLTYKHEECPLEQEQKTGWNNHQIACMLADLFGDTCACNYNGIDEWLGELCDFKDTCCPNPVGVACWEQFLKYLQSRYTECGCEAKDKNALQEPYKESEE